MHYLPSKRLIRPSKDSKFRGDVASIHNVYFDEAPNCRKGATAKVQAKQQATTAIVEVLGLVLAQARLAGACGTLEAGTSSLATCHRVTAGLGPIRSAGWSMGGFDP